MTRLQYLRLQNRDKLYIRELPPKIRLALIALGSANVEMWDDRRGGGAWTPRIFPDCPLYTCSAYRISEKLRPAGIPDDIHERIFQ